MLHLGLRRRRWQYPPGDEALLQLQGHLRKLGTLGAARANGQLEGPHVHLRPVLPPQLRHLLHNQHLLAHLLLGRGLRQLRRQERHGLVHCSDVPRTSHVQGLCIGSVLHFRGLGSHSPKAVESLALELRGQLIRAHRCAQPQLLVVVVELEDIGPRRRRWAVAYADAFRLHLHDHGAWVPFHTEVEGRGHILAEDVNFERAIGLESVPLLDAVVHLHGPRVATKALHGGQLPGAPPHAVQVLVAGLALHHEASVRRGLGLFETVQLEERLRFSPISLDVFDLVVDLEALLGVRQRLVRHVLFQVGHRPVAVQDCTLRLQLDGLAVHHGGLHVEAELEEVVALLFYLLRLGLLRFLLPFHLVEAAAPVQIVGIPLPFLLLASLLLPFRQLLLRLLLVRPLLLNDHHPSQNKRTAPGPCSRKRQ
mmetsp:Transcript_59414/g.150787  ORF Transcript_59414/g.150787 Transcript_59414/m.150787 type:complete len:423 (+) Transcript_59414:180-1448(+)